MSVSDLSSEQTGPNLRYLICSLLICVILQIDVHVTMRVGVHSLPEVLYRDIKWSCHLNTSGMLIHQDDGSHSALSKVATAALGGRSRDRFLLLPPPPGLGQEGQASDSPCLPAVVTQCHRAWRVGQGLSQTTGQSLLWDNGIMATINKTAMTTKCCV